MILIIEDTLRHQEAARVQLSEVEVEIVNYDKAYRLLKKARPGTFSAIISDLHFKIEEERGVADAPFDPCYPRNMEAIGTEIPFGLAFVLKAVELQTPVVLYSDTNHHEDLTAGLMDIFGYNGFYPSDFGKETKDPIKDPEFLPLCGYDCRMAEDMHWDGQKIVLASTM